MIATGTDIKPLEVVLFMRDGEKSAGFFEQMKGRGVRDQPSPPPAAPPAPPAPPPAPPPQKS